MSIAASGGVSAKSRARGPTPMAAHHDGRVGHMKIDPEAIRNRLLRSLPVKTLSRLLPIIQPTTMLGGMTIDHVDGPITQMYFINRGMVSLVKAMRDGRMVEVGAVGIEGVTDP